MTDLFDRARALAAKVPTVNPQKRLQERADALNRAGLHQMALDHATASMVALSRILFDLEGGRFANIDPVTRRVLIPVPWGAAGWRHWDLRKWEGEILRAILMSRVEGTAPILFVYDDHQWYVMREYNTTEEALGWLKDYGPTLEEWRPLVEARRERYKTLMRKQRATTG